MNRPAIKRSLRRQLRRRHARRRLTRRLLRLASMGVLLLSATVIAAPSDVLQSPGNIASGEAPKGTEISAGDGKVSSQTGSFNYSIPIVVPPGRGGAAPSISLGYSSQAPLYGGLAAGWSLSLPTISRDFSDGLYAAERWTSSLAGRELVTTSEPAPAGFSSYRAQSDTSYARYQRGSNTWRVLTMDGSTLYFGESAYTDGVVFADWKPLTRSVDKFGNEVQYNWEPVYEDTTVVELRLSHVEYGMNANNPALSAHARVELAYNSPIICSGGAPVGSKTSYRSGQKRVMGSAELASITSKVSDGEGGYREVRRYDLDYDQTASSCSASNRRFDSPSRQLKTVTENARSPEGAWTAMPPVTFSYGGARDLSQHSRTSSLFGSVRALLSGREDQTATPLGDAPEQLFLDMDGDGLKDVVRATEPDPSVRAVDSRCYIGWRKNLGELAGGGFALGSEIVVAMPTVPWKNHDDGGHTGGFYIENLGTRGAGEICSVVGQFTLEADPFGSESPADCSHGAPCGELPTAYAGAILIYSYQDFNRDGLVDLVTGMEADPGYYAPPKFGSSDIFTCPFGQKIQLQGAGPYNDGPIQNPWPPENEDPPPPAPGGGLKPMSPCNGTTTGVKLGWNVYLNDGARAGSVQFGSSVPLNADYSFISDVPVQKQVGEPYPTPNGGSIEGQSKSLVDVDGDGFPDVVDLVNFVPNGTGGTSLDTWELRIDRWNEGQEKFSTDPNLWAFEKASHLDVVFPSSRSSASTPGTYLTVDGTGQLVDIHGDGLPDLLEYRPIVGGMFQVRPNLGASTQGNWAFGEPVASGPFSEITVGEVVQATYAGMTYFVRDQSQSLLDVDNDGRLDIVTPTEVRWGLGEGWLAGSALALSPQKTLIKFKRTSLAPAEWSVETDWVDVNGDGLPERIEHDLIGQGQEAVYFYDLPAHGAPRGVLHSIDNGRGLTLDVAYAPHTNSSVVTMGASGQSMLPNPTRVVKSITATHAHGGTPAATTTYAYELPEWNEDSFGTAGFRGFKKVTSTGPSGSRSEERFDYSVDWSGRLETSLVYAAGSNNPHSISTTDWEAFTTLGAITTFYPELQKEYLCEVEIGGVPTTLAEAACLLEEPLIRDASYEYVIAGGENVAIVEKSRMEAYDDPATGNPSAFLGRCFNAENAWVYTATDYRVVRVRDRAWFGSMLREDILFPQYPDFGWNCYGDLTSHTETTFDSTLKIAERTCSARSSSDIDGSGNLDINVAACSAVEVDPATGVVLKEQTPEGFNDDGGLGFTSGVTTYTFDSNYLFPTQVSNALGHTTALTTDLGTGVQLSSHGPNAHQGGYQEIDGFGRTLHEWVSDGDDPDPNLDYLYRRMRDVTYHDDESPTRVVDRIVRIISTEAELAVNNNSRWAEIQTSYDGAGRPIIVFENAFGAPVEVTSTRLYAYDASGNLVSTTTPDPSKQKYQAGDVVYTFQYDSLNRRTCALAPDGSGVATIHGGRWVKTVEFGSDGGDCVNPTALSLATPRAASTARTDIFGRVIRVEERLDADLDTWTGTNYVYDGNSNIAKITREDTPNDIVTDLVHDFVGNRIEINRHDSLWTYTYDLNGNMLTQTPPIPSGKTASDVMTSTFYDHLNRPLSQLVPQGSLSLPERDLLGVGETTFEYDQGLHGIGKLTKKTSPTGTVDYTYFARGNPRLTTRSFDLSDISGVNVPLVDSLTLTNLSWTALDQPASAIHPSGQKTYTQYHRWPSVPKHVYVYLDDGNEYFLNSRNAAGLSKKMTHLKTNPAGGPQIYGRHIFTGFDQLGRVTQEYSSDTGDDKISQLMTYFGTSEVETMQSQVGPVADTRNFTFAYDDQHQLIFAEDDNEGEDKFTSSFTFKATGRLDTAYVTAPAGVGTMVANRNVTYEYSDSDPERVTGLSDNPGPETLGATYTYDDAGNMIRRDVSGGSGGILGVTTDLVYDAENRLRIRKLPDGTEERYFYDGPDRWLAVQVGTSGTATGARVWFGGEEIEYDCSPTACSRAKEKTYVRLGGRTVARVEKDSVTGIKESKIVHSNGLGHTLGVYSYSLDSGVLSYDLELGFQYGPFGELLDTYEAPGADADGYRERFNGKELDTATGLSYYGYRYYDPLGMIWNRSDPKFRFVPEFAFLNPRSASLYTFSANNPVRYVDSDGREWGDGYHRELEDAEPVISKVVRRNTTRIVGATKVASGGAAIGAGSLLCSTGIGCALGAGIATLGADVAAAGARELVTNESSPTLVGIGLGSKGQMVEEALVGAAGMGLGALRALESAGRAAGLVSSETAAGGVDDAFEVVDGVRRSKAADLAAQAGKGDGMIRAEVLGSGGKVVNVPAGSLHSPFKAAIDTAGPGLGRWLDTLKKTFAGSKPPPILVQPGSRGPKIRDVLIE